MATAREALVSAGTPQRGICSQARAVFRAKASAAVSCILRGMTRQGGGGGGRGRRRERGEANRVLRLTAEFMADVGWWKRYVEQQGVKKRDRVAAPFCIGFVKQALERTFFSDAS